MLAFFGALALSIAMFLPFLIYDKGYFIFYGDFNVQQIPFYRMAHDAVRSGNIFWNWTTDLGANFIGSYSFYLLGSPFFWLTLPFPSDWVPYMMAPLLMLKFSLTSLAAYAYMRRFAKPDYAFLGGLLYAFSGFSIYNIFFNHFHESILYFPLMLLAMERYMVENKRGWFAVTVFLSALCNYYFFIGQALFLILYWIIRSCSPDWKSSFRKFVGLLFEAVAGTALAGVLLLPSFYAVIQNPRTDRQLSGWDLLIYSKPQRLFDIIHSFFFPQDIPARAAFFPDSDNKWSSMSAWLPVFGFTGVLAFMQSRHHTNWLRRLLLLCFIIALIPGLNALFQLFNSMYYARWYYMMVCFMALATVKVFDEADDIPVNWKRAFGWIAVITASMSIFVGVTPTSWKPDEETGKLTIGLFNQDYPALFFVAVAVAAISLLLCTLLVSLHKHDRRLFFRWSMCVTAGMMLIFGWYSIGLGKGQGRYDSKYVIQKAIEGRDAISLPDLDTVRVDFNSDMDNLGMHWQIPTIQAFHSIVPGSVMEFYPSVGVERSVGSRPNSTHYPLRSLLSVRWLFDYTNKDKLQIKDESSYFNEKGNDAGSYKMPGYVYYGEQNGYAIYENEYYIPFGFTYDTYMTRTDYEALAQSSREFALLKAIVLEDDIAQDYASYLMYFNDSTTYDSDYTRTGYFSDCLARKSHTASSFSYDNTGFSATISMDAANLVFFSVPYEDGWSATVNGEKANIVKANVGFMAVLCPAGEDVSIRFTYKTPGLMEGLKISGAAAAVLIVYFAIVWLVNRHRKKLNAVVAMQELWSSDALQNTPLDSLPISLKERLEEEPQNLDAPNEFDLYRLYPPPSEAPPAQAEPQEEETGWRDELPPDW